MSGTVAVSNFPASQPVTDAAAEASLSSIDGKTPVLVSGAVPVTGPLTDTQLRATPVPISGTVTATGPLTDTQLRATPVPVSGTVTATGPLTDTQLRATPVPISAASLPLPTGAAQDSSLTTIDTDIKATQPRNIVSWGGATVAAAIADAPVGSEIAPVTRPIFRKKTTIESTVTLAGAAVFTGAWHDSELEGTICVVATSFSDKASSASGMIIQESDDNSNANFTRTVAQSSTINANGLGRMLGFIRARYWRIVYNNGASAQTSFELTSCATNAPLSGLDTGTNTGSNSASLNLTPIIASQTGGAVSDNVTNVSYLATSNALGTPLISGGMAYGGAFSGTTNATKKGWAAVRTSTVFKQASASATGNTAVWTPAANNKFRLLGFKIQVSADATTVGGARITIGLQDATTDLGLSHIVFVPAAAGTALNGGYDSGFVPLGSFGILAAAVNDVLNVNLSAALSTGVVNVIAMGVEE